MPIIIIATTIGGLGSIGGTFLGGICCGIIQQITAMLWNSALQDVPLYVLLLLFIAFRPTGFFGLRSEYDGRPGSDRRAHRMAGATPRCRARSCRRLAGAAFRQQLHPRGHGARADLHLAGPGMEHRRRASAGSCRSAMACFSGSAATPPASSSTNSACRRGSACWPACCSRSPSRW